MKKKSLTYKQAGVDVQLASDFVSAIAPLAKQTHRAGVKKGIGGFGSAFQLSPAQSKGALLVASADGVGTKLKLAQLVKDYSGLGIDLVAMNVNDLICTGAEPLFFLDYIATGKLKPDVLLTIMKSIAKGCKDSNCALLGGETAEMPQLYSKGDFDLAGFAVGTVTQKGLITGERVKAGDQVIGLASSGPHSNGYTLIQKALSTKALKTHAKALLKPTQLYVKPVMNLLKKKLPVRGIAHITGGSFDEKASKIVPKGLSMVLRKEAWQVPTVFKHIQAAGVAEAEMYRTFNMGVGLVVVVPKAAVAKTQSALKATRTKHWVIGEIQKGKSPIVLG